VRRVIVCDYSEELLVRNKSNSNRACKVVRLGHTCYNYSLACPASNVFQSPSLKGL